MAPSAKSDKLVEEPKQDSEDREEDPPTDTPAPTPIAEPEPEPPEVFPLADAGPYYIGMWGEYPNYGCPYCLEAHLADTPEQGTGIIELHILSKIDQGDVRHMEALNKKES